MSQRECCAPGICGPWRPPWSSKIILDILNDKSTNGREIRGSTINPVRDDRYFAAHLLGDLKDPRAVPILIPLLRDTDVNYIVPWSLGEIGDKSAEFRRWSETLGDTEPRPCVRLLFNLRFRHCL